MIYELFLVSIILNIITISIVIIHRVTKKNMYELYCSFLYNRRLRKYLK